MPGQPARSTETKCVWCDPDAMARALEGGSALMNVRVSLSMFEQKDTAVYARALALLPVDFSMSAKRCQNADCVFSSTTIAGRAYAHKENGPCLLCDANTPLLYETDESVRARVNQILNRLQKSNPPGYKAAMRLFPESLRAARYCQNPDCCYSLKQPRHTGKGQQQWNLLLLV